MQQQSTARQHNAVRAQWRNFKFWAPRKETNWALLFLVPSTRPTTATYHHNSNTSAAKRQPGLFTTKLVYMYRAIYNTQSQ